MVRDRLDPLTMHIPAFELAQGLGLIFDLDGVLVDSMPLHIGAWREYLKQIGRKSEDIISHMHGRRNDEIFRDFAGFTDESEIFMHGARKEALYRQMMAPRLQECLVPGVRPFLERTKSTGAGVGLASNAERANIDFVLDGAALRPYFQTIVDGSQVERPKPSPEVYLLAAENLRLNPANCIVFEDSEVGVAAARSAGARVVGILTGKKPLSRVELAVVDFSRPELDTWLTEQRPVNH